MINLNKLILFTIILTSTSLTATEFEITPFFGKMYSSDLLQSDEESELSLDGSTNFGIAIAWQDSSNGQGQILINSVSHDFESDIDSDKHSLDIIYTHFSGIAQFRQQSYVTTVSLGLLQSFEGMQVWLMQRMLCFVMTMYVVQSLMVAFGSIAQFH